MTRSETRDSAASRRERLAEELRANLKRRKARQRGESVKNEEMPADRGTDSR